MEYDEKLYWLFVRASLGDGNSKWEVIDYYSKKIKELCYGDRDMEHNMMLSIYDLLGVIMKNFETYLKEDGDI